MQASEVLALPTPTPDLSAWSRINRSKALFQRADFKARNTLPAQFLCGGDRSLTRSNGLPVNF